MPVVNIVDELFIVATPASVRSLVCDTAQWERWLPGVRLSSYDDRGPLGVRWTVSGELTGTAEAWLEEHGDGTIVHAYLRADPVATDARRRRPSRRRLEVRYVLPLKRGLFAIKDLLEAGREPGKARVPIGERVVSASQDVQGTRRPRPRRQTGTSSKGDSPDGRPDDLEHRDSR